MSNNNVEDLKARFAMVGAALDSESSSNNMRGRGNGGGDGGMDDLNRRVASLETSMAGAQSSLNAIQVALARMEEKLASKDDVNGLRSEISPIRADVAAITAGLDSKATASSCAEIKTELAAKATTADVAILKGRVDSLPSLVKVGAIVALVGAALKYLPGIFSPSVQPALPQQIHIPAMPTSNHIAGTSPVVPKTSGSP